MVAKTLKCLRLTKQSVSKQTLLSHIAPDTFCRDIMHAHVRNQRTKHNCPVVTQRIQHNNKVTRKMQREANGTVYMYSVTADRNTQ